MPDALVSAKMLELEKLLASDSRPDIQQRARRDLCDLIAATITGRLDKDFVLYDLRLGNEQITLTLAERDELKKQANLAWVAIQQCVHHDTSQGLRCGCCDSFKRWYWSLREGTPLERAGSALWDKLNDFACQDRPKPINATVEALLRAFENRSEERSK